MGELSKSLGKRIKQIRESMGIKQCVLAERLEMEPSNLTRIESGYQFPKEENLVKIANALNVEVKDLFVFSKDLTKEDMLQKITSLINTFTVSEVEFLYNFILFYKING